MVRNFVERIMRGLLLETPGDGGGGGGTETQVPGNDGTTKPGAADGSGKPKIEGQPGTGGKQAPVEDPRIKGFLADLQKERTARQKLDADHKTAVAELERERKRVRALSGLDNPTPEEADEAQIRERLERMYPGLKGLSPEDIADLKAMKEQMAEVRNATTNTWRAHGQKMLDQVTDGIAKSLGGKLSDRQSARIQRAYVEEARSNPDFLKRHEAGDPKLVAEFVKDWLDDFVEPGRRSALQEDVQRRPRVPTGKDRSIVGADNKPIDVKDDKAVGDFLVAGFKNRGGQFGRR